MRTIRERIEAALRDADPDQWFTQREIAEMSHARYGSVRGIIGRMRRHEGVLEVQEVRRDVRNPRTGDSRVHGYRWRR